MAESAIMQDELVEELEKVLDNPRRLHELLEAMNPDELEILRNIIQIGIIALRGTF